MIVVSSFELLSMFSATWAWFIRFRFLQLVESVVCVDMTAIYFLRAVVTQFFHLNWRQKHWFTKSDGTEADGKEKWVNVKMLIVGLRDWASSALWILHGVLAEASDYSVTLLMSVSSLVHTVMSCQLLFTPLSVTPLQRAGFTQSSVKSLLNHHTNQVARLWLIPKYPSFTARC